MKTKLKGSIWELVSYKSKDKNGETIYPLGDKACGYIYFSEEGLMSVQIMATSHDKLLSEKIIFNTKTEQKMREFGYHAYSGRYEIDEEDMVLTTTIEMSLFSEYINTLQKRAITLNEHSRILRLSNINHPERELIWKKVEHLKTS